MYLLQSNLMKRIPGICFYLPLVGYLFIASCKKENDGPATGLSYNNGRNIIYLKNQSSDYIIYPDQSRIGDYEAWPEGIEIDDYTGAINVSDSETGLKYKIKFTAPNGDTSSTIVLLSGITFPDKFYHMSLNDSIALPVYNANASNPVPLAGSNFDEGNLANSGGCSVETFTGEINLAQSIRNGIFGAIPQNDERKDFEIKYRLNDESDKALNKIQVRLYYYNTLADVPADVWQILDDRQNQGVFLRANTNTNTPSSFRSSSTTALAKPRPPCVIIIGQ